jgi:hypothetical protein
MYHMEGVEVFRLLEASDEAMGGMSERNQSVT